MNPARIAAGILGILAVVLILVLAVQSYSRSVLLLAVLGVLVALQFLL